MKAPTYHHQEAADLAWCIGSNPLMLSHPKSVYKTLDEQWFQEEYARSSDWLRRIDAHPKPLREYLQSEHRLPLGKRFERYLSFWLQQSDHFELIAENVQLQNEKGTVGEIDFIFRERLSGRVFHMEAACKFYLAAENTPNWKLWIGPGGRDTLQLKMDKLEKQLAITKTPEGMDFLQRERIPTPEPVLFMKGMLFHHFASLRKHKPPLYAARNYLSGWWSYLDESDKLFSDDSTWAVLPKSDWLSTYHTRFGDRELVPGIRMKAYCRELLEKYKRPLMTIRLFPGAEGWEEGSRGFVVPGQWPGNNS